VCTDSAFEVLADPRAECGPLYSRALTLDDNGKALAIAMARQVGSCSTCTGGGTQQRGFRATVFGVVQGSGSGGAPPTIIVSRLESSTVGCAGSTLASTNCLTDAGGLAPRIYAHASLMLVSWGALLPLGVIVAKFARHYPNAFWFKFHRIGQLSGIVIALIGWIIALVSFDVFSDVGSTQHAHGIMGCIAMTLGVLQPINAFLRPHNPEQGEKKTMPRRVWEVLHKASGYIAVLLAIATVALGTTLFPVPRDQIIFQVIYGVIWIALIALIIFFICTGKNNFERAGTEMDYRAAED